VLFNKTACSNALGYGHSKSNGQVLNIKVTGSMSSMACLDIPYFSVLSHKRHNFRKKKKNLNVCFDCLYNPCLKHLILERIRRDTMINVHRPLLFLSDL